MPHQQDPQAERLYEWERSWLEPKLPSEIMSQEEVRGLVARVSAAAGIVEPTVVFVSVNVACKAKPWENKLEIADWGRSRLTILHEIAHLATWPWVIRGDAPHGRAFTTVAIILYNRFLGFSLEFLSASAANRQLDFDTRAIHAKLPSESQQDFYPEEF